MTKGKHRQSAQPSHDARQARAPKVGVFFVVGPKLWVAGIPWAENLSVAGFRTYAVGHPDLWKQLQEAGAVPCDLEYDETARGRVNYEDASGRFTLFADKCIIRNKRLVSKIMNELSLPKNTGVLPDDHYRCPRCLRRRLKREQAETDWNF
jgi:hypothetical protein